MTPNRSTAATLTRDPQRLQALCELWRGAGSDVWLTLQGASMTPTIRPGARLRVRCDRREPVPGNVVAYRQGGLMVVHRLVRRDGQGRLICQGDANAVADPPVALQDVLGVVAEVVPPPAWVRVRRASGRAARALRETARRAGRASGTEAALIPVVVALARSGITGKPVSDLSAVRLTDDNWAPLTALASAHGLPALVGAGAAASGVTPPAETAAALQRTARVAGLRAARAWDEIALIVDAWEQAGVEAIVLKGAVLAARHYPSSSLRPFGDIDLLVRAGQRDAAADILIGLGYRCTDDLDAGGKAWCLENHFHWTFMREGAFPVELHWRISFTFPPTPADLDALWERSERVTAPAGRLHRVRALEPVDEVLSLTAHMTGHCFRLPLRCHADFAAILRRFTPEAWKRLWERAERLGWERDLRTVLGVGRTLGFLDLPPEAAARVDADHSLDLPFLARYAAECPFMVVPERWLDVGNAPSRRAALVRLFRVAFPRYTHLWTPPASGTSSGGQAGTTPARLYLAAWSRRACRLVGSLRELPNLAADYRRTARIHRMFGARRRL